MNDRTIRVLLVEDNQGDALLAQHMLSAAGDIACDLEHVRRLSEGLSRVAQGGIDVVLLDLSLPDGSGPDTFSRMHEQAPSVPIIVMSGLDDKALAIKIVYQGAGYCMLKGQVDLALLVRSIRYAIERK